MSKFLAPLTAMVLLAACGGDGGGGASRGPALVPALVPTGLESYLSEAQDVVDAYPNRRGTGPQRTRAANLPSGKAVYNGAAALDTDPNDRKRGDQVLVGRARVDADFDRNRLAGTVTDFVNERDRPVDGRLTIRNGVIERNTVRARIGGQVAGGTLKGGFRTGGFAGRTGEAMIATGRGRIDGGRRAGQVDTYLVTERAGAVRPDRVRGEQVVIVGPVDAPETEKFSRSVVGGAVGAAAGLDMNGNPITGANIGAASGELSNDL